MRLLTADSPLSEGIFVAKEIGRLVGGVDMLAAQSFHQGKAGKSRRKAAMTGPEAPLVGGFSDIRGALPHPSCRSDMLEKRPAHRRNSLIELLGGRIIWPIPEGTRELICLLRLLDNPDDPVAHDRLPGAVIGLPGGSD